MSNETLRVASFRETVHAYGLSVTEQEAQLLLGDRATRKHAKDS